MKDTNQKRKINNRLDFIKMINLPRNATKEVKSQFTDWENIFAIHVTGKIPVSSKSKEHLQINNEKDDPATKWTKDL